MIEAHRGMLSILTAPPFSVSRELIARCGAVVEPAWKREVRAALLPFVRWRYGFAAFGEGSQWGRDLRMAKGRVFVGRYAYVGPGCEFGTEVVVGDLVMISAGAVIFGDDHRYDDPDLPSRLAFGDLPGPTLFEADAWVGRNCLIRAGTRFGRGCVVGAGSVVARDVPPYAVVAGVPARVIKYRYSEDERAKRDAMMFGSTFMGVGSHVSDETSRRL